MFCFYTYINVYCKLLQLYHRIAKQHDKKASVSEHVEVLVALLVQKKLTVFILSSYFLRDCWSACFWNFGNCSLCSISTNCIVISTHSGCSMLLINGRFTRSVFSVQVISLPSGMNKDISQSLL